jgi:hypothetical protein
VGHWSSSSDRIHNCELWSRQRSSLRPPHAPKSYLSTHLIHFHQAATPNDDEHELHRRLRSQKASNRSFLRRHGNGREGLSHFWKCTTHAHMHTHAHKHKHKHTAIGVAGGVLTVLYQSLDIPLEAGQGHLGGPAIKCFIVLEEPLGTDVFGMDRRGRKPELACS